MFTFSNAYVIQINLGTKELLKNVLDNMGYWQKESEIEKMVGCFKLPLGWLIRVETLCTFGFFGYCD